LDIPFDLKNKKYKKMKKSYLLLLCCLFAMFNTVYAMKPLREYSANPETYGLAFETRYLQTVDSFNIITWHIPPVSDDKKDISIIISSSDAGNMSNWLLIGSNLAVSGFDVWLYDYRGFGGSSDFPIEQNMLYYEEFVKDLTAVVKTVKNAEPKNKICLLGYSMGTVISMKYLIENQNSIDFYIGDGHVYSPEIVVERLNKITDKSILLPETSIQNFIWKNFYENFQIPVMLYCASEDIVCTEEDINRLKNEVKNLTIIPYTGKHLMGFNTLQVAYLENIESFLSKK
jgi:alpha-beta hydrolase superfamily lysophospholipase